MGTSQLKATIKKIEIMNRSTKDDWQQSIRVVLGDIELNNENLIGLRRFRPDEPINVSFQTCQLSFEDMSKKDTIGEEEIAMSRNKAGKVHEELFTLEEGEIPLKEGDVVVTEFKF